MRMPARAGKWSCLVLFIAAIGCGTRTSDQAPRTQDDNTIVAGPANDIGKTTPHRSHSISEQDRSQATEHLAASSPEDSSDADLPFAADIRSLRLRRSIAVRATPHADAERIGTVARDTRVAWTQVVASSSEDDGCRDAWVEVVPRGWICQHYLEPSTRYPHGSEVPRLGYGEIVPGVYGQVTRDGAQTFRIEGERLVPHRRLVGSVKVRRYREVLLSRRTAKSMPLGNSEQSDQDAGDWRPYWLIDFRTGEYLPRKYIRPYQPSTFKGIRLGDDTGNRLPMGFVLHHGRRQERKPVAVYRTRTAALEASARPIAKLPARTVVKVAEIAVHDEDDSDEDDSDKDDSDEDGSDEDGSGDNTASAYRIDEERWIQARDVRVAMASEPPPGTGPHERWLDIDLQQQLLIAYEGRMPVYATLFSAGTDKTPTETGIYRVFLKLAETDMSDLRIESPYSVATVPWSQFYAKDLALHTSYWHDRFGTPRSHGCTNLAPRDARFLYFWSEPQVPPGWSMIRGSVDTPGTLIRVRSAADPDPEFRGYAKEIYEARIVGALTPRP